MHHLILPFFLLEPSTHLEDYFRQGNSFFYVGHLYVHTEKRSFWLRKAQTLCPISRFQEDKLDKAFMRIPYASRT